ncbi:SDR family oxidoreductase [bacterium]|nr:SDR family oxidoreductase [bacterium]
MKQIVIVGGSHGVGKALLHRLLSDGNYGVINISRGEVPAHERLEHHVCDVMQGFPQLNIQSCDGLVYCPGSINLKPFHRLSLSDFQDDLNLNYLGAVRAIQALIGPLKRSKNASVVLFSTVAATQGMPFHSSIAGAKAAVEGLTRSLAAEYAANNIRFNCLAPSVTDTPLAEKLLSDDKRREASARRHPLNRFGQPDDLASMAEFLLSDKANWITGQVFGIDGGLSTLKLI